MIYKNLSLIKYINIFFFLILVYQLNKLKISSQHSSRW